MYNCIHGNLGNSYLDDSPGEDEGELDHVSRDAAVEYLFMPEYVKELEAKVGNVLTVTQKRMGHFICGRRDSIINRKIRAALSKNRLTATLQ